MQIYMQIVADDDKAPRFYHLLTQQDLLGGWTVIREWGYQGSPGRVKREHFEHWEDAEMAMLLVRDQQIKRGYRIVFVSGESKAE